MLLRMEQENHPNLEEAHRHLSWNGVVPTAQDAESRTLIDTQGNVHPDQFWQDILLGNVKRQPFSEIWEGQNKTSAETLHDIRSIGTLSQTERQARMVGPCASCRWFSISGSGFRTRAAYGEHGGLWGSDPGCCLNEAQRTGVQLMS